jgi:hypothetical protein
MRPASSPSQHSLHEQELIHNLQLFSLQQGLRE